MWDAIHENEANQMNVRGPHSFDEPLFDGDEDDEAPCNDTMTCAICLGTPSPADLSFIKGCEHLYCVNCILQWSSFKNECPQCKHPFHYLHLYRQLDGTVSDCALEEPVVLLKRATWHMDHLEAHDKQSHLPSGVRGGAAARARFSEDFQEEEEDFEDEEDLYYFQGRARVVLGNRRFGVNGYVRGGRTFARAVNPPLPSSSSPAQAPGPSSAPPAPPHPKASPKASPAPKVKGKGSSPKVSNNPFKGCNKGIGSITRHAQQTPVVVEGSLDLNSPLAEPPPPPPPPPIRSDQTPCHESAQPTPSPNSDEEASFGTLGPPIALDTRQQPKAEEAALSPMLSSHDATADNKDERKERCLKGRRAQRAGKRSEVDGVGKGCIGSSHFSSDPHTSHTMKPRPGKKGARPKLCLDDEGDD